MKQLLVFLLFLCSASVSAQDVIVKKDGSTIVCRVVELTDSEITYKKWSDLNGSNYVMNRADASAINYENGKKVNLSEATNLYTPNNQNDGTQQYNDKALLKLDYDIQKPNIRKARLLKTIGWIIGGGLVVGGGVLYGISADDSKGKVVGPVLALCGAACTTGFILAANHAKNQGYNIQTSTLYQQDIQFSNGSSLSLDAGLLRDNTLGHNTLGFGLRYNF